MPPFLKKLGFKKPGEEGEGSETEGPGPVKAIEVAEVENPVELTGIEEAKIVLGLMEDPNIPEGAETPNAIDRIKKAGVSGSISYALWELVFWTVSVPAAILSYHQTTGEWLDLSSSEGQAKVLGFSTAFLTFARFVVPVRIGLALATAPWVAKNILPIFGKGEEESGTTE